ncbi:MAG: PTS sugar transporter subunit IIA [Planctomycetota bacterium]
MQLLIKDAALIFSVDEETIRNWIEERALPACHLKETVCFDRAELLEWAAGTGTPVAADATPVPAGQAAPPLIAAALEAGGVHLDVPGGTVAAVLDAVVARLVLPAHMNRAFLHQVLLAREAMGSTAIGNGIAVPHPRNPIIINVAAPSVTLCHLAQPIDYGAVDGVPVAVLFTLISPNTHWHLHLLSRLMFLLRDGRFTEALKRRAGTADIVSVARRIEAALPGV